MRRYKKDEIYYLEMASHLYVRVRYEGKSCEPGQGYFVPIDNQWACGPTPDYRIKTREELTSEDRVVKFNF